MMRSQRPLLTFWFVAALALTGLGVWSAKSEAAKEPGVVPTTWELTFKQHTPERMITAADGQTKKETYWYMRYTVTNNTGQDLLFTPEFVLITDTGQKLVAGKDPEGKSIDPSIFKKIKALHNNALMESPIQIMGKILQGEDNAKDGVAIFTGLDPEARNIKIYVSGLSGETAEETDPITKQPVTLHKTLVLDYDLPGQAIGIEPKPQFRGSKWVMK